MDEATVVFRATALVSKVAPTTIPVPVEAYVEQIGATLRQRTDLEPNEPGWSFKHDGKQYICVNANDQVERQRFTVCHELGHIVLGLASDHGAQPWWSYAKRSPAEIMCDLFAAELLLPTRLFRPLAEAEPTSLATVDELAARFSASTTATGSRYAAVASTPCAFVLSEQGKVRYASRSASLRSANAWIRTRINLPRGSVSANARAGEACDGPDEIEAEAWFHEWDRGGVLLEEARHLSRWDQTLTLLWFENEVAPESPDRRGRDEEGE
jgi:Zn-dependent peptidase ImmA (M78 family)